MQPSDIKRVKAVFTDALELTGAERETFLDQACGDDAAFRAEVDAFLAAAEREADALIAPLTVAPNTQPTEPPREGAGETIGNYKLLQLIGEGGFGSVFMAEQETPVRRRVALKIIKLGMNTKEVIARFEAERQALAMMDHPNIAKIFDAGATASGRPYFVMELVKGIPITQYCDMNKLATEARLELFVAVCNALQHAHQKGVIHRDIKPSNILVTLHDGKPVPKLIDFGIAKATQSRLTERTLFTEFNQLIGTPAYMSPEQAEMSGLDIDTRSDIYSLGVLLYELLTGTTPFDPRELRSAAYAEFQRIIREVDPPKPSTRLSTLGEPLTAIAANRDVDPRKLSQLVRGELDWIVMKSLEKDRTRRYESAGEMARDINRHLEDQPVEACPPSTTYRLRKLYRRNRAKMLTSAAILIAALIAVAMYVHGIRVEQHKTELALADARTQRAEAQTQKVAADQQRDEARRQKTEADRQRDEVEKQKAQVIAEKTEAQKQEHIATSVNGFLSNMLSSADPEKLLGDKVTVVQAIQAAVKQLNLGAEKMDPLTEAALRDTIGTTLYGLSRYADAEIELRKALAIRRTALPEGDRDTTHTLNALAILRQRQNDPEEAETLQREALELSRKYRPAGHSDITTSLNNLATLLADQNRPAEAEVLMREALTIRRKTLPPGDPSIAASLSNLGALLARQNKLDEAEQMQREALAILRSSRPVGHPDTAAAMNNLANILVHQNKPEEAEALLREALETRRKNLPAGHPDLATSLINLGQLLSARNKPVEAEAMLREALAITRQALPVGHPLIAKVLNNLSIVLVNRNKLEEAESVLREALEIDRKSLPANHPDIAVSCENLAVVLMGRNKPEEAEKLFNEVLDIRRKNFGPNHPLIATGVNNLAALLSNRNELEKAEPLYREALEIRRKVLPAGHPLIATSLDNLASLLLRRNKPEEAEKLYREALEIERKSLPAGHPDIATTLYDLGFLMVGRGRAVEAEPLYREALTIRRASLAAGDPLTTTSMEGLAYVLQVQKKASEAEGLYREVLALRRKNAPADEASLFSTLENLAYVLQLQNKLAESEPLYRESLEIRRKLPGGQNGITLILGNLAYVLEVQNQLDDAETLCREILEIRRKTLPPGDPAMVNALYGLADVLMRRNKLVEAKKLFGEALEIARKALPPGNPVTIAILKNLGILTAKENRADEMEAVYRELLENCRKAPVLNSLEIANAAYFLGWMLCNRGENADGLALLREAVALQQKALGPQHDVTKVTAERLALELARTGSADEAKAVRAAAGLPTPQTQPSTRSAETLPATPEN